MSLEITLYTETIDDSYATPSQYCADYYDLRVNEVEEAVVEGYVEDLRSTSDTASAGEAHPLVSIVALCSPNITNATASEAVSATFSIRFVAYASSMFSRNSGATIHTVKLALNAFFQDKVDSGDWASDRLAQATDSSWTASSRRRLEDTEAAQDFISPQSVVSVETTIVETLNPTSAPSFWPTSLPSNTPSRCPTSAKAVSEETRALIDIYYF